jgi:hypothetical protein
MRISGCEERRVEGVLSFSKSTMVLLMAFSSRGKLYLRLPEKRMNIQGMFANFGRG